MSNCSPIRTGMALGVPVSRRRTRPFLALMALLVLACAVPPSARAQFSTVADALTEYTVILDAPSVGEWLRESKSAGSQGLQRRSATSVSLMRRAVARRQDPVKTAIEALGIEVLGSVSNVLNAVFVRATPEQTAAIAGLPGVRDVVQGRRYEPMLRSVAKIVHASAAYVRPVGHQLFGEGMKIAIIDSGLDFDHEAFSDPSLPSLDGYPLGDSPYLHLANTKVIVVRSYIDSLVSRVPASSTPDDLSPNDLSGHGTAVAMIAAGRRVRTPLGTVMGIAPKARLGVYKVFGSPGLNYYTADHVVIAAIDDAVADGMDILNLSLGNPEFYPWDATGRDCSRSSSSSPCNPISMAAHSAVHDFGRVVVAAAGNYGLRGSHAVPALSTLLSPANTPSVITVGGTGNSSSRHVSVRIAGHEFVAESGTGPEADGPLTKPAVSTSDLDNPLGCDPYEAQALAGRIAVIERGTCFFRDKVEHADAAGASGVLVTNHEGDDLLTMGLLDRTDIPAFLVGKSAGEEIRELLADPMAALTLDPVPIDTEREWAYVTPQSSRGPNLALQPKPDLVAPGESVYTAAPRYNDEGVLFASSGFREVSGTSFAAPVVSGSAALIWQAFPALTSRQVASALINTASPVLQENGERERVSAAGAGVLNLSRALRPNATAVPPSVAFGSVRDVSFPVRRQVVISNRWRGPQYFVLRVEPRQASADTRVTVNGRSAYTVLLASGQTESIEVRLEGTRPPPGAYEGLLRLTSLSGLGELCIPYLYLVGDNEPANATRLRGHLATGIAGEAARESVLARVLDQYGVPVSGREVEFIASDPSISVATRSPRSGPNGLIHASVRYTGDPGTQLVTARIGNLEIPFEYEAVETRPQIVSIANSATLDEEAGAVAGSMATISGSDLAAHPSGEWPSPQVRPLPLTRKGATVAFDGLQREFSVAGPIYSITPDAVTVQVPWEAAGASRAYVKVRNGNPSEHFVFQLAELAPGIFQYESGGRSYALALHPDSSPVTAESPAARGGVVNIAMTGNGPVATPPRTGSAGGFSNETVNMPTVWIGDERGTVVYSGLDPDLAGLYLVTVQVPLTVAPGEHSLRVEFNGVASNEPLLPVN